MVEKRTGMVLARLRKELLNGQVDQVINEVKRLVNLKPIDKLKTELNYFMNNRIRTG